MSGNKTHNEQHCACCESFFTSDLFRNDTPELGAERHRRRLAFLNRILEQKHTADAISLVVGRKQNVCYCCNRYLHEHLDQEVQASVVNKQYYLQAIPRLEKLVAIAATNGSLVVNKNTVENKGQNNAFSNLSLKQDDIRRETLPQQSKDINDCKSRLKKISALHNKLTRIIKKQTLLIEECLRIKDSLESKIASNNDQIEVGLSFLKNQQLCTDMLHMKRVEMRILEYHTFEFITDRELKFEIPNDCPSKQIACKFSCAKIDHINFGFAPISITQKQKILLAVHDVNMSLSIAASIVSIIQNEILVRLSTASEKISHIQKDKLRRIKSQLLQIRLVVSDDQSYVVLHRQGDVNDEIVDTQPCQRQYDLYLEPGKSRISFNFGLAIFLNLIKTLGIALVNTLREPNNQQNRSIEWIMDLKNLSVDRSKLGGQAMSFLNIGDGDHVHLNTDFDPQLARETYKSSKDFQRENQGRKKRYHQLCSSIHSWNLELNKLAKYIKLMTTIAVNTHR